MRSTLIAATLLAGAGVAADDGSGASDIETTIVVGKREPGPVFQNIAELCDEIPNDLSCRFLRLGDDAESSMGPHPGPYTEVQPCGDGSTDGACFCNTGE